METQEKVFMSSQLIALLPSVVVKLLSFILMFQKNPNGVMLYEHRFARMLKITDEEVQQAIQTLINLKLISLTKVEDKFKIEFNKEQFGKYYRVEMQKVLEHNGYQLAKDVTYNKEFDKPKQIEIEDMSEQQIKTMILRLQASLNEKEQLKKKIVNNEPTDLPW